MATFFFNPAFGGSLWNGAFNWGGVTTPSAVDDVIIQLSSTASTPVNNGSTSVGSDAFARNLILRTGNRFETVGTNDLSVSDSVDIGGTINPAQLATQSGITIYSGAELRVGVKIQVGSTDATLTGTGFLQAIGGTISAGTITVGGVGGTGLALVRTSGSITTTSQILIGAGSSLTFGGLNASDPATAGGLVQASAIALSGGTIFAKVTGTSTLNGAITGNGTLTVDDGILALNSSGSTYSGATNVLSGGTLRALAANSFSANSTYAISSGGTLDLAGVNNTVNGLTGSGSVVSTTSATLTISTSAITTFSGVISGALTLRKEDSGSGVFSSNTMILTGANTYTGETIIAGGRLQLQGSGSISESSTVYVTGASSIFEIGGISGPLAIIRNLELLGGTIDVQGKTLFVNNASISVGTGAVKGGFGADSIVFNVASVAYTIAGLTFDFTWSDAVDRIIILGNTGDNTITGSSRADGINGDNGFDALIGGGGNDSLNGDGGNDTLNGGTGADSLDGGAGLDTVTFGGAARVIVNLFTGQGFEGEAAGDRYAQTENVIGTAQGDIVVGSIVGNLIDGVDGADVIYGNAGNDILLGGAGADTVFGEADNDLTFGWLGADVLWGGDGNDTLWGEQDNDTLLGEVGNDVLLGIDGNDVMYGWIGNDTLFGFTGEDVLWGEQGNDQLFGENGNDTIIGGLGRDTMTGGVGADQFFSANSEIAAGEIDLITAFDATDRYLFQSGAQIQYFNFNAPGYGTGAGIHVQVAGGVFILDVFGANAAQLQAQTLFF